MEDRFGCEAIMRAMRPEGREEMPEPLLLLMFTKNWSECAPEFELCIH